MDGLFKYIGNRRIRWCVKLLGPSRNPRFGARALEKKSASCVITASAPTNDHAQVRFCTLWVGKQQEYAIHRRCIKAYSPLMNILSRRTFSVTSRLYEIYLSIKDLEILAKFCFVVNCSSMYTKICLCHKLRAIWRNWRLFSCTTFIAI